MSNILDYLEWRGDLNFRERPFNDVDNLILSELAYIDLRSILQYGEQDSMLLSEVYRKYAEMGKDQSYLVNNPTPLLEKSAGTVRFGNLIVKDYVDLQSQGNQFQFAAMTFELGDGTIYVAYRGTDNSLVGWREDLNFSFMESTPAQLCAADYLDMEGQPVVLSGGYASISHEYDNKHNPRRRDAPFPRCRRDRDRRAAQRAAPLRPLLHEPDQVDR